MTESTATQASGDAQGQQRDQQDQQVHEQEQRSLYEIIGGETRLRELVDRFYDLMQLEGDFAGIHAMHPVPNHGSRDKLFMFLSGWMGGPNLFIERYGHPMLRARHLPYAIGTSERDQWLRCMAQALEDMGYDYELRLRLMTSFYQTADWMRNKPN
jgi:hemoglobin